MISDGTQTAVVPKSLLNAFESDVISDGTQTIIPHCSYAPRFESDVISDGTQTNELWDIAKRRLRVM